MPSKTTAFLMVLLCISLVPAAQHLSYAEEIIAVTEETQPDINETTIPVQQEPLLADEEPALAEEEGSLTAEDEALSNETPDITETLSGTVEGTDQILTHKTGLYYTVKKGDTLWDLSTKFFDSPWAWPNLWQENNEIPNPHLIYPGNRIRIYSKDSVQTIPQLPEAEPEPEETAIEEVEEAPVEEEIEMAAIEESSEEIIEEPQEDLPFFEYIPIEQVGFIKEKQATAHGTIFKAKADKTLISTGDIVYVKQNGTLPIIAGSLYTLYRTRETPITDKKTGAYVGIQHGLKGMIEITEIIKEKPLIAAARIVKSYHSIRLGDLLLPYKRRSQKITLSESKKDLVGKFLVAENHAKIFGENFIAFINKGEQDGVKPGQTYSIFEQETTTTRQKRKWWFDKTIEEDLMPIDFGSLIVLHAEQTTSTVLITESTKAIHPETKIRTSAP